MAELATHLPEVLRPDVTRTVLRPFIVEDPSTSDSPRTRAARIMEMGGDRLRGFKFLRTTGCLPHQRSEW
jgi:hypothetical protein